MSNLSEFLRDIEDRRIPDLREQLEPLESGKILLGEVRGGVRTDITQNRILWLKRWIAEYEAMAAKLHAKESI